MSRTDGNNEKDCEYLERFPFEFAKIRPAKVIFVGFFNGDFHTSAAFSTRGIFQLLNTLDNAVSEIDGMTQSGHLLLEGNCCLRLRLSVQVEH